MLLDVIDSSYPENPGTAVFTTHLSSHGDQLGHKKLTSFSFYRNSILPMKSRLGTLIYARDGDGVITLKSIFPFGGGIYRGKGDIQFEKDDWRRPLIGIGLARAIEHRTLSVLGDKWGHDCLIYTDLLTSNLRRRQLKGIGFEDGITLRYYLGLLKPKESKIFYEVG